MDIENLESLYMWTKELGKYTLDVSKYILTGVVITSLFKDFDDKVFIYFVGIVLSILCLIVGLILTNSRDDDKNENINSVLSNNKKGNKRK